MRDTVVQRDKDGRQAKLAVIGLGYVGLPLALAFAKHRPVIGYDINSRKLELYRQGIDATGSLGNEALTDHAVEFTSDAERLAEAGTFIITVPTPVQKGNVPDLQHVEEASRLIAGKLRPGSLVVYESTVYPGVTEDICIPILEQYSGLKVGRDFKVGYSPERINPGDAKRRLENIVKIVSGNDEEALELTAELYESIIHAGVYRADSIKIAEAAKVVENAQRDVNIAFMNELSILFHHMGIDTKAVLDAASTKWNFLPFTPGLVGGHCISIDPYYLTFKAEDTGYRSKLILAGRHINDAMGVYVTQQIIKQLVRLKLDMDRVRIAVFGVTYKENCSDIRNSKVKDIVRELGDYGITPYLIDPYANADEVMQEFGIPLTERDELANLHAIVTAVPHQEFARMTIDDYEKLYTDQGARLMVDVKGIYDKQRFTQRNIQYWRL